MGLIMTSLNIVLKCLKGIIIDNKDNTSALFLSRKVLFLVGLCLGSRISELFALRRDEKSLIRMEDSSIKLFPDLKFLAKNEKPLERRGPMFIKPLVNGDDTLCPVKT